MPSCSPTSGSNKLRRRKDWSMLWRWPPLSDLPSLPCMTLALAHPRLTFPPISDICAGWAAPQSDYETVPWGRDRAQLSREQWLYEGRRQGQGWGQGKHCGQGGALLLEHSMAVFTAECQSPRFDFSSLLPLSPTSHEAYVKLSWLLVFFHQGCLMNI